MNDLISRNSLIRHLNDYALQEMPFKEEESPEAYNAIMNCITAVEEAPTAKTKPVVHCKDCIYWHEETGWCKKHSHFVNSKGEACHPWESNDWKMFDENYFCADGKEVE